MSETQMAEQVIRADKRLQAFVVAVCMAGALVGAMAILWVLPWGQRYLKQQEARAALGIVQMVMALVFLGFMPFAIYLFWLGQRVVTSQRMPPPDVRVIRDTRVIEGDRAVARGRTLMGLAVILLALSLVGGLYFPYRLSKIFGPKLQGNPSAQVQQAPKTAAR